MTVCSIPTPSLQGAGRRSIRRCEEVGDTWLQAAHDKRLALSSSNNIVGALHRFFTFLDEQGKMFLLADLRRWLPRNAPQSQPSKQSALTTFCRTAIGTVVPIVMTTPS
jgi:hypothetical protein